MRTAHNSCSGKRQSRAQNSKLKIQNSKITIAAGNNSKLKTQNSKLKHDPISETHY